MEWIIFAIGAILLTIASIGALLEKLKQSEAIPAFIISVTLMFVPVLNTRSSKPSALDVYQGKTTLKVTYQDGVPVDSIVVFKTK